MQKRQVGPPHFPQFLSPGNAAAPVPLEGSTELEKKEVAEIPVLGFLPYLGPGNLQRGREFPLGALHHMFLLTLASWHQIWDLFSAILLSFHFPSFLPGCILGAPSRKVNDGQDCGRQGNGGHQLRLPAWAQHPPHRGNSREPASQSPGMSQLCLLGPWLLSQK